jgi:ubiquinone/menaquinone biosynthesis C-methylase UbiE
VQWQQGQAEATNLPPASFDLVTASLLLRETPPSAARAILRECFRLLRPGGQVIVLDANQKALRQAQWLTEIVAQPDMRAYASESIEAWMGAAGFEAVQTQDLWLIHQVTKGIKPTRIGEPIFRDIQEVEVIDAIPV